MLRTKINFSAVADPGFPMAGGGDFSEVIYIKVWEFGCAGGGACLQRPCLDPPMLLHGFPNNNFKINVKLKTSSLNNQYLLICFDCICIFIAISSQKCRVLAQTCVMCVCSIIEDGFQNSLLLHRIFLNIGNSGKAVSFPVMKCFFELQDLPNRITFEGLPGVS